MRKKSTEKEKTIYYCCMTTLLSFSHKLSIVQVGANDRKINDPIYEFAEAYRDRTKLILVEPQNTLVPYLAHNYAFHPDAEIFNGAVGPQGNMTLFAVKKQYWEELQVPYASNWPKYRAPSGVTSASRAHVYEWLRQYLPNGADPNAAIEEFTVECLNLTKLLERNKFPRSIDILQVDAEGFDDEVIYACDLASTKPRLVNFEAKNLSTNRFKQLEEYLNQLSYLVHLDRDDALAIRTEP